MLQVNRHGLFGGRVRGKLASIERRDVVGERNERLDLLHAPVDTQKGDGAAVLEPVPGELWLETNGTVRAVQAPHAALVLALQAIFGAGAAPIFVVVVDVRVKARREL